MKKLVHLLAIGSALFLAACSSSNKGYDYSAFKESKPRSVLVLMPTDTTTEVKAGNAVLAQATMPLAEAGYYVFPSALVHDTFKHNGLTQGQEIQNVNPKKLHDIFGADTALYINVEEYGVSYVVFDSVAKVSVKGKLVDLRSGKTLWEGSGFASSSENNNSSGNIFGQLIAAAIAQVINTVSDRAYPIAGIADARLLSTGHNGGLLYGPYHPNYGKDPQLQAK